MASKNKFDLYLAKKRAKKDMDLLVSLMKIYIEKAGITDINKLTEIIKNTGKSILKEMRLIGE